MGSIIKKKIKNNNYYYYVESKRVNGKPRYVNQKYLGSADKLLEKIRAAEAPLQERVLYSDVSAFGDVALLYDIASRLKIQELIDQTTPKRKQGASIGMYILTAAINRATAPSSTNGLKEWYSGTCLPMLTGISPNLFTPQNFWNNTSISQNDIEAIENDMLKKIVTMYDIDTSHIVYDATNFFTYIDTKQKCETAKRGHSKEKRNDLRIVGLSLMVAPDCNIPLLHETYPGNRPDATQFRIMMEHLKSRYESITGRKTDVTVVFDRGNNSEDNINYLEDKDFPLHFVGGLRKTQLKELLDIPLSSYVPLKAPAFEGQCAYRTVKEIYGRTLTVVMVYNPALEEGQMQGILFNRERTTQKLLELQQKLMRRAMGETTKGKKPTVESVTSSVENIFKTEYMKDIFSYEVIEKASNVYLTFASSDEALEKVRIKHLGKTGLFTDRDNFTNEEIVSTYRSAWHVESAFKQLKNTEHLTVRPIFHWTDDKIRVHIFTCVLAYRLCCLLVKELSDKGIRCNINQLLDDMSGIKRVDTFFGNLDSPEKVQSYTKGNDLAHQVEAIYQLKQKYF